MQLDDFERWALSVERWVSFFVHIQIRTHARRVRAHRLRPTSRFHVSVLLSCTHKMHPLNVCLHGPWIMLAGISFHTRKHRSAERITKTKPTQKTDNDNAHSHERMRTKSARRWKEEAKIDGAFFPSLSLSLRCSSLLFCSVSLCAQQPDQTTPVVENSDMTHTRLWRT